MANFPDILFSEDDNAGFTALQELDERFPDVIEAWRAARLRLFPFSVRGDQVFFPGLGPGPEGATIERLRVAAFEAFGRAASRLKARREVMATAFAAKPERFVSGAPRVGELPTAVWINRPANTPEKQEAAQ